MAKTQTKDELILALQKTIEEKKSSIAKTTKSEYITNGSFRETPNSVSQNINTLDEEQIIRILAYLISQEFHYKQACEALGRKLTFKHQDYTLDEWKSDLSTRIAKLAIASEKKKLASLEERLSKLESPELKEKKELDDIMRLLNEE